MCCIYTQTIYSHIKPGIFKYILNSLYLLSYYFIAFILDKIIKYIRVVVKIWGI